jgi:hypothetical protein
MTRLRAAAAWLLRPRGPWLHVAVIVLLFAGWAFATPLGSVPDEPAHIIKAASIWQGQLRGHQVPLDPVNLPLDITAEMLRTPYSYSQVYQNTCSAFYPDITAACAPPMAGTDQVILARSAAGPYPPLFYALVGWPTRLFTASVGVYVMRLASAAACAALAALALLALRRRVGPQLAFVAVTVAITPELAFLAGSVNPNGLEIAGALACWAGLASVAGDVADGREVRRVDLVATLAGTAGLALSRSLGPFFTVAVVAAVLLAHGRAAIGLVRRRAMVRVLGAIAAIVVAGTAWVVWSGHLSSVPGGEIDHTRTVVQQLVERTDDWVQQMIAVFGWLDTGPVLPAVWGWLAALALVLGLVWLFARGWRGVWTLLLVPIVVLTPVIIQYPGAAEQGIAWQGRYGLALGVGVPVMAVVALGRAQGFRPELARRLVGAVALFALVGHTMSAYTSMRRYAVGVSGPVRFWAAPGAWAPPLGYAALIGGLIVTMALLALSAAQAMRDDDVAVAASDDAPDEPVVSSPSGTAGDP